MEVFLTNDDGIYAVGLRAMYRALVRAGHNVHVVAPLAEQSAVGHAITFSSPLQVKEIIEPEFRGLGVMGFPADCVKLGISNLVPARPDIVVSGINSGANVGVDVIYSGTVSAATEGALMGFRALAVSMDTFAPVDMSGQADYAAGFIGDFDWNIIPPRTLLNLNFPAMDIGKTLGIRLCPQTSAVYDDWYDKRHSPRGRVYYWLDGEIPAKSVHPDSDRALLTRGYITLTPLKFDFTDYATLDSLAAQSFFRG